MTNKERQSAAPSFNEVEGENTVSSSHDQDPVADDDENAWRGNVVESASDFLGTHPTLRLDCALRKCRSR